MASTLVHPSQTPSPAGSHATAATFGNRQSPNPNAAAGATANQGGAAFNNNNNNKRGGAQALNRPAATVPHVIDGPGGRILCVADVRGNLSSLNTLAREANAQAIIHTGDFGFYETDSFSRISDRTLRHLVQYSTLIHTALRNKLLSADVPPGRGSVTTPGAVPPPTTSCKEMRKLILDDADCPLLTQFPDLLSGKLRLEVPVYTVWGACEDVRILEKLRTAEYIVPNLNILDEATSHAIDVGGVRLRLFGLGGAVVLHKLFDNGEGAATIAGGQGTMWTTILQIGELVDTAQKSYDASETRILVTHASPGREGLLMQLALALKADLTISAGLHFRYGVSYNEFSVQPDAEALRRKLNASKASFGEVWDSVRSQVEDVIDDQQRVLLNHGLAVTNKVPPAATSNGAVAEEPAWKNTWNWNLPDAAYGHLVLDLKDGRISSEMKSQGFNFAYRRNNAPQSAVTATPLSAVAPKTVAAPSVPPQQQQSARTPPSGPKSLASRPGSARGHGSNKGSGDARAAAPSRSAAANGSSGGAATTANSQKEKEAASQATPSQQATTTAAATATTATTAAAADEGKGNGNGNGSGEGGAAPSKAHKKNNSKRSKSKGSAGGWTSGEDDQSAGKSKEGKNRDKDSEGANKGADVDAAGWDTPADNSGKESGAAEKATGGGSGGGGGGGGRGGRGGGRGGSGRGARGGGGDRGGRGGGRGGHGERRKSQDASSNNNSSNNNKAAAPSPAPAAATSVTTS